VTFLVFKVAVKKANIGGPMKPAVNTVRLKIGQINPSVNALWGERCEGLYIKAYI
jgi:hypothetical protein